MTTTKNAKFEPMMSVDDLSAYLQVPVATIYRWNSQGTGPAGKKIGRFVRYHRADVDEWIKNAQPSG